MRIIITREPAFRRLYDRGAHMVYIICLHNNRIILYYYVRPNEIIRANRLASASRTHAAATHCVHAL